MSSRFAAAVLLMTLARAAFAADPAPMSFDFTGGRGGGAAGSATIVGAAAVYTDERGYGFEPGAVVQGGERGAWSDAPFRFSVRLHAEGNYRVKLRLNAPADASTETLVRAEARRVMLPVVHLAAGQSQDVEFAVNVRTARIDDKTSVALNDRERDGYAVQWDDRLTLEFCGKRPAVSSLRIEPAGSAVTTVFLAGDSTVCDQTREPWSGWGQMLPQFFTPDVAVANHAMSGRSLRSFRGDRRWAKLLGQVKPGDHVLIQFGHNDMKEKGDGVGAFTTYADALRTYVAEVRERGGTPVLLTPMNRRRFEGSIVVNTFGDYPEAVRRVAAETGAPLIDLFATSKTLYEAFGPERSKLLFAFFPTDTFAGQSEELKDNTHFREFGGDQIARCVVQGLRDLNLPIAQSLRPDVPPFDPAKPGDFDAYHIPPSASGGKPEKPEGS